MHAAATVLLVDDNFLLLEMLTKLCQQEGLHVLSASSGEAALTWLRSRGESIDWLFTDISLPGLVDGWEVAAAYRDRHPTRPIIYASSYPQIAGLAVAGSIYVRKPFRYRDILALATLMADGDAALDSLRASG